MSKQDKGAHLSNIWNFHWKPFWREYFDCICNPNNAERKFPGAKYFLTLLMCFKDSIG